MTAAAPWRVREVRPLEGYRIEVTFGDGTTGEVDLSRRVRRPDAGVFALLADPEVFGQVSVEFGAVTWPGEIDLAPDAMYDEIRAARR